MKFWTQWSRRVDGWVERRRRFQKTGVERTIERPGETVPAVIGTIVPAVPVSLPDSGKAPSVPGQ